MNRTFSALIESLQDWILSPVVFVVLFSIVSNLRRSLASYFAEQARKNRTTWVFQMLKVSRGPLQVLLFLFSFWVSSFFLPVYFRYTVALTFLLKVGSLLALGWILNQALGVVVKNRQILPHLNLSTRALILALLRLACFALFLITLLDTFGIDVKSILISLGIGSLPIGLALQDVIRDSFNGLYLLIARPFKLGDCLRIEEPHANMEGQLVHIGWRSAKIYLFSTQNTVLVPNSKLLQAAVTHFELPNSSVSFSITLQFPYQSDLEKIETIALESSTQVLKEYYAGGDSKPPLWRLTQCQEACFSATLRVTVRCFQDQSELRHRVLRQVLLDYQKAGISLYCPKSPLF